MQKIKSGPDRRKNVLVENFSKADRGEQEAEHVFHGVGANDCAPNSASSTTQFEARTWRVQFERAHNTQVKAEKEEEKREKQQAILLIAAKSVELLRKEYELKKVNETLEHVQRRQQAQAKINQAD